MTEKIRVLVVDHSEQMSVLVAKFLGSEKYFKVVGTATDPHQARDLVVQKRPDVIILDADLPNIGGLRFLRKLMTYVPTPTVMLVASGARATRTRVEAMEAGAVEVLSRPIQICENRLEGVEILRESIMKAATTALLCRSLRRGRDSADRAQGDEPRRLKSEFGERYSKRLSEALIVIGASTGGVEALAKILPQFPRSTPGIVVVVHMPHTHTQSYARRLDNICCMRVKEAEPKDEIQDGHIFIAPGGGQHVEVVCFGGKYRIAFTEASQRDIHVPSVDVLFRSAARAAGHRAVGLILTGMGYDGAAGSVALRKVGATCLAQDEASCVVFGMPRAALKEGGAERAVSLMDLPRATLASIRD